MTVPYSFASRTTAIPLSELDSNFNTPITLGNTAIQLGNTVTTLNNMTLANVTISSGTINVATGNVTVNNLTAGNTTISTSETLSYGTANGVAYLNGSKVLTTGSALTFDGSQFKVSYTTTVPSLTSSTGAGLSLLGSSSLKLNFGSYGTANYGAWIQTTSDTGASYPITLNPLGGPVGIGVQNPVTTFQVNSANGSIALFNGNSGNNFISISDDNNAHGANFGSIGGGNAYVYTAGYFAGYAGGSEQMRLTSTGLGIGTSSPTAGYKLDVSGSIICSGNIYDTGTLALAGATAPTTANNERITISNQYDGTIQARYYGAPGSNQKYLNVGWNMQTYGSGSSGYMINGVTGIYRSSAGGSLYVAADQHLFGSLSADGFTNASPTFTERMRIDSSGNVGIGTSSPSQKLDVNGNIAINGTKFLSKIATDSYIWNNTNSLNIVDSTGNTVQMRIDSSGNFLVGTTTASGRLTVMGDGTADASIIVANSNRSTLNAGVLSLYGYNASVALKEYGRLYSTIDTNTAGSEAGSMVFQTINAGTLAERMRINSSGNVGIGTSSPASFGKLTVTDGLTVRGYNGSPSGNNSTTVYSNGGKGGTFSSVTIDINFNTTAATTGIVNLQLSGYNAIYLDYLFTFYAATNFTSFTNATEVRKTTGGVTVAYSVPSAGVARFVLTASVTHPVINLVVTSGGTNFVEPSSITYTYA